MTTSQIVTRHIQRRLQGQRPCAAVLPTGRAVKLLALLAAALVLGACAEELLALALAGALVICLGLP